MKLISPEEIAGVCGKFSRPEYRKEGLHLLVEMSADAQLDADREDVRELFEEIEKHWEMVAEEGRPLYFRFDYDWYRSFKKRMVKDEKD